MADPDADGATSDERTTLHVRIRAEHMAILRACAAREGTSPEELAALWLEEKADEARKLLPASHASSFRKTLLIMQYLMAAPEVTVPENRKVVRISVGVGPHPLGAIGAVQGARHQRNGEVERVSSKGHAVARG